MPLAPANALYQPRHQILKCRNLAGLDERLETASPLTLGDGIACHLS